MSKRWTTKELQIIRQIENIGLLVAGGNDELKCFHGSYNENVWLIFKFLPQFYYENIKLIIVKFLISYTPFIQRLYHQYLQSIIHNHMLYTTYTCFINVWSWCISRMWVEICEDWGWRAGKVKLHGGLLKNFCFFCNARSPLV